MRAGWWVVLAGCAGGSSEDTGEPVEKIEAQQVADWCDAVTGPAGERSIPEDLAIAHVGQRLFGPDADWAAADTVLVGLLAADDPFEDTLAPAYADAFDDICHGPAAAPPPAASVELVGDLAVVVPGPGDLTLPAGAAAVVVDLRDAPTASRDDVLAAAALAVDGDVQLGPRTVRQFLGFPSQYQTGVYSASLVDTDIVATGDGDLPLFVLTPQRLAPETALAAGGLRVARAATLVGYDVHTRVAESAWTGVGDGGLAWRASHLVEWPDVVPADISADNPEAWFDELSAMPGPSAVSGASDRTAMGAYEPIATPPSPDLGRGEMRAALSVAHGTLHWFYPYFDLVGYRIDTALAAGLEEVDLLDDGDRPGFQRVLGRYMHELDDGHGFYGDIQLDAPAGYIAVQIERVDGAPMVRATADNGLLPGDVILEVDGTDATAWYDEAMSRRSAASIGYRFDLATRELKRIESGTRTLLVRGVDGDERTVELSPVPYEETEAVPWGGTFRPSGWLDDLGAPDLYYVNVNGQVGTNVTFMVNGIQDASDAAGMVVDMRDYPSVSHYTLAAALRQGSFSSALFDVPVWSGPFEGWIDEDHYDLVGNGYTGPIAWIVSNHTVSAAENFSMMFADDDRVTFVGQQSASTNGNITLAWLPGSCWIYFTGMEVLFPDGAPFHGIGIQPDVVVAPTAREFADGIDPELEAAIDALSGG